MLPKEKKPGMEIFFTKPEGQAAAWFRRRGRGLSKVRSRTIALITVMK